MTTGWSTSKMAQRHEQWLVTIFGGRQTRGSGNQWKDPLDGKQAHGSGEYVFAWDGKATLGKSLSVTKAMWEKICRQAKPYEIPIMPLRFYADERLTRVDADLVVVEARVLSDLQRDANEVVSVRNRKEHAQEEAKANHVPMDMLGNAMMCPTCGAIVRGSSATICAHPEQERVAVHVEMGHT